MATVEKLKDLWSQIESIKAGVQVSLKCPFCGAELSEGDTSCCPSIRLVVPAILRRMHAEKMGRC